ncbi:hypothetical protein E0485_10330 [Paenibacillus albiflavus]|uniref:ATPase BadF/BadG/BcrA/BcrD type domain-containing protein n=1 Tax=Paenibacillus albiflavus TaxID=2545760 RepID=A0A4R4EGV3_9BACL|nr:hypothetical protein E0485_10330 [Paenibacillus albiflavus]
MIAFTTNHSFFYQISHYCYKAGERCVEYCLSLDGGGTKLAGVLFDKQYNLIASGRGQSINYVKQEEILETIHKCLDECLFSQDVQVLNRVYITMPASADLVLKVLQERVEVAEIVHLNEGLMSLLAGLQCMQGVVVLAGTGSGVFQIDHEDWRHIGGWGNLLGDEGSACFIGREGINAVLREYEHRGERTVIRDLVEQEWSCSNKQELLDCVYQTDKPRNKIASVSILVARAALSGDEHAIRIFEQAGALLALQTKVILEQMPATRSTPIMIAGSVWKGCEGMLSSFRNELNAQYPTIEVQVPLFEPVVGGVVAQYLQGNAQITPEFISHLSQQYSKYLYISS